MNNDGPNQTTLPPLPPSDEQSIAWNRADGFYGVRSRDFWGKNQISSNKVEDYKRCNHYFVPKGQGVECKACHMGFYGNLKIEDGNLIYKGKPLMFNN